MYALIVEVSIDADRSEDAERLLNEEVVPTVLLRSGLVSAVLAAVRRQEVGPGDRVLTRAKRPPRRRWVRNRRRRHRPELAGTARAATRSSRWSPPPDAARSGRLPLQTDTISDIPDGIRQTSVIDAAEALADAHGFRNLTLAMLASDLGMRSQSLYAHVDGIEGLRRQLALRGQQLLGDELRDAVMARSWCGGVPRRGLHVRVVRRRASRALRGQPARAGRRPGDGGRERPNDGTARGGTAVVRRRRATSSFTTTAWCGPASTAS